MAEEEKVMAELEAAGREVEALKHENEVLKRGLETREGEITRLEGALATKDGELATLKENVAEKEAKLTGANQALAQAVVSYKELAIKANPDLLPEMLAGGTVEDINKSLANARSLVERVKQGLEAEAAQTRIPLGSPQRAPLDLSALTPREKIQYAIGGNK